MVGRCLPLCDYSITPDRQHVSIASEPGAERHSNCALFHSRFAAVNRPPTSFLPSCWLGGFSCWPRRSDANYAQPCRSGAQSRGHDDPNGIRDACASCRSASGIRCGVNHWTSPLCPVVGLRQCRTSSRVSLMMGYQRSPSWRFDRGNAAKARNLFVEVADMIGFAVGVPVFLPFDTCLPLDRS